MSAVRDGDESDSRISDYVCPQCGPAPEGADAHADRAHTWPPRDESVAVVCQWCDGSGEANNPLNADPAVALLDWHPPVQCPRCKGTGKDPDDGSDYWYLCFECGSTTVARAWTFWKHDIEGDGSLIPAEDGDMDPVCRCPACGWDHVDDDSNPGIADGTRADVEAERARALADTSCAWGDHWDDHWAEVARGA